MALIRTNGNTGSLVSEAVPSGDIAVTSTTVTITNIPASAKFIAVSYGRSSIEHSIIYDIDANTHTVYQGTNHITDTTKTGSTLVITFPSMGGSPFNGYACYLKA